MQLDLGFFRRCLRISLTTICGQFCWAAVEGFAGMSLRQYGASGQVRVKWLSNGS
jgi:hypothetical protein